MHSAILRFEHPRSEEKYSREAQYFSLLPQQNNLPEAPGRVRVRISDFYNQPQACYAILLGLDEDYIVQIVSYRMQGITSRVVLISSLMGNGLGLVR